MEYLNNDYFPKTVGVVLPDILAENLYLPYGLQHLHVLQHLTEYVTQC